MATLVTRYVNTNASSGGNGTTNATVGVNRAYATLQAALTALGTRDLVANDEEWLILCDGTSADTTAATVPAFTGDATRFLRIEGNTNSRAGMTWSTSKYRLSTTNSGPLTVSSGHYVRVGYLQIEQTGSDTFADNVVNLGGGTVAADIRVYSNHIRHSGSDSIRRGIRVGYDGTSANVYIFNNVIYGCTHGIANQTAPHAWYYHNTVARCALGYEEGYSSRVRAKNNLFYANGVGSAVGFGNGQGGSWNAASTLNASDDTTATRPSANGRDSQTFTFVNAASDDYSLTSGDSGARNQGADLSADSDLAVTLDLVGTTRDATPDIGAFEVSGGGGGGFSGTEAPLNQLKSPHAWVFGMMRL